MGLSQSNIKTNFPKSDYEKIIHKNKLQKEILKVDLIQILASCDKSLINCIWNYSIGQESHCSEFQFDEIVEQCRFRTAKQWIKYLLSVAGAKTTASASQIHMVFDWVSFSNEKLYSILIQSFPPLSSVEIDLCECLMWIDRNLPEFGIDLARYIHRTLTCQMTYSGNIKEEITSVVSKLQSELILPHIVILLCSCLPMCYKTSEKVEDFVFMNVNRWTLLYSSNVHGLSASKLKEKSFDYDGSIILLIKCDSALFCVASDIGLKEDWNTYGGVDARFLQLEPFYKKHISGTKSDNKSKPGIIYSHFSAKSGRRGIFVGHQPLAKAVLEIDDDLTNVTVLGRTEPIRVMEVFAAGSGVQEKLARLKDVRHWEDGQVARHKDRKLKAEDWTDNPDREILGMGGINVRNADLVGGIDRDLELPR